MGCLGFKYFLFILANMFLMVSGIAILGIGGFLYSETKSMCALIIAFLVYGTVIFLMSWLSYYSKDKQNLL